MQVISKITLLSYGCAADGVKMVRSSDSPRALGPTRGQSAFLLEVALFPPSLGDLVFPFYRECGTRPRGHRKSFSATNQAGNPPDGDIDGEQMADN